MPTRGNTIRVTLQKNVSPYTEKLYQFDYGQKLIIEGIELPESYEVHFSNDENGLSKTMIGNAYGVDVPDEMLLNGKNIFVWVFLHNQETDGETEYRCTIPVIKRAKPSDIAPTPVQQDVITQAIATLNHAVEQTGQDVIDADAAKDAAEVAQEKAEEAQAAAETAQGKAEEAQTVAEMAQGAAENAQTAAETAQGKAEEAQTAAETAQGKAEEAQIAAETAQEKTEEAQAAAETAQGKAEDAQTAAEHAAEYAEELNARVEQNTDDIEDLKDTTTGLRTDVDTKIPLSMKGSYSGVAELDENGKVPSSQLPSYVDDVVEYPTLSAFPEIGESGKIYVATLTNKNYRWSGSTYIELSKSITIGETSSTAYRGDRGKIAYDHAELRGTDYAMGFYKVETNQEGHVVRTTGVTKNDIVESLGYEPIRNHQDISGKVDKTSVGVANGVAELDSTGKVPAEQLPEFSGGVLECDTKDFSERNEWVAGNSYEVGDKVKVTDGNTVNGYICIRNTSAGEMSVEDWEEQTGFPATGENGKVYIADDTNITYRWDGSAYVTIGSDLALGETSTTAYRGDRGAAAYAAAVTNVESAPSSGSGNLITSGAVYTGLDGKADKTDTVLNTSLSRGRKGLTTVADGSFAFGNGVEASGLYSHAEGSSSKARNVNAHAEGDNTTASGLTSHAEGGSTTASGTKSHAEGDTTTANALASHSEGYHTSTTGQASHAEGVSTATSGYGAHAEGYYTSASGQATHASGGYNAPMTSIQNWVAGTEYSIGDCVTNWGYYYCCKEANSDSSFDMEKWREIPGNTVEAFVVGNGSSNNSKSNAMTLDWSGDLHLAGDVYAGANNNGAGGSKLAKISELPDISGKINSTEKGAANGVAELDSNGKVPSSELPSYVDDVIEGYYYDNKFYEESTHTTEIPGETGKVYVDLSTEKTYRWSGSAFVVIGNDLALGETSSTAYRGDRGAAAYAAAVTNVESAPSSGSGNLITSGAVYTGLSGKADKTDTVLNTTLSRGRLAGYSAGTGSIGFGLDVKATGQYSQAYGEATEATGRASHAEGSDSYASNSFAHAEGYMTRASGSRSHSEGDNTKASGNMSHAEGDHTTASGMYAHAEGYSSSAAGQGSHAEGISTAVSAAGYASHAEGNSTTASGESSHSEGYYTVASGNYGSHAEGMQTIANGYATHASGMNNVSITVAPAWTANTTYNVGDLVNVDNYSYYRCKEANSDSTFDSSKWDYVLINTTQAFVVGNGVDEYHRANALTLDWSGDLHLAKDVYVNANANGTGGSKVAKQSELPSVMTGAGASTAGASGLVPAPASGDNEKFLRGDGTWVQGGKPMVVLSYGNSTWADFIAAYNSNVIVYCRASSNSNPATGAQNRMAFMAYVNDGTSPTEVEFQYYRSVSTHSANQQGDQVFVYKLNSSTGWSVTTREAYTKMVAGTNLTSSYSSGVLTINGNYSAFGGAGASAAGTAGLVPAPAAGDNTKVLKGDGTWGTVSGMTMTVSNKNVTFSLA